MKIIEMAQITREINSSHTFVLSSDSQRFNFSSSKSSIMGDNFFAKFPSLIVIAIHWKKGKK